MTSQYLDKIICRSLSYEARIGFHDYEQGISQRLVVDVEALVAPIGSDQVAKLRLDYFEANRLIAALIESTRYNLIEAVAEEIAALFLKTFAIEGVKIGVTKFPHDMPNATSVTYECTRMREI